MYFSNLFYFLCDINNSKFICVRPRLQKNRTNEINLKKNISHVSNIFRVKKSSKLHGRLLLFYCIQFLFIYDTWTSFADGIKFKLLRNIEMSVFIYKEKEY